MSSADSYINKRGNRKPNIRSKRELIIYGIVMFSVYFIITFILSNIMLADAEESRKLPGTIFMSFMIGFIGATLCPVTLWRMNYNEGNASFKRHVINWILAALLWSPFLFIVLLPFNDRDSSSIWALVIYVFILVGAIILISRHQKRSIAKKTKRSEALENLPSNMKKSKVVYKYKDFLNYIDIPKRGDEETWDNYTEQLENPVEITINKNNKIYYNYCHALLFSDSYSIKIKKNINNPLFLTYTSSVIYNVDEFIETEDIKLNDNLDIFCDDAETVFYILTPQVIEAINKLIEVTGKRVIIFFLNGWMHLFVLNSNLLNHLTKRNIQKNYQKVQDIALAVAKIQNLINV